MVDLRREIKHVNNEFVTCTYVNNRDNKASYWLINIFLSSYIIRFICLLGRVANLLK